MLAELEKFARERLAAHRYPDDAHIFTPARCPNCGVVPLALTIQHHTGSRKGNFRGVILAQCADCGDETRVFSFTGAHRESLREEKPICACGNAYFIVAECERFEREEGIAGFFDEGVVVGKCSQCGRKRAFVHTD